MRRLALALASAVLASAAGGGPAWGATFVVDSAADQVATGSTADADCDTLQGACTLRAAVQEANGTPGADTISLPDLGADYLLTLDPAGENFAASGDLDVRDGLAIVGSGQPVVRSDGDDRVFHLGPVPTSPVVTITGIEVRGGAGVDSGAGIFADSGALSLSTSTVAANVAADPGQADGGGVWLDPGSHAISHSTISGNRADGQSGATGGGMAVASGALLTISTSTVSDNSVTSSGGSAVGGGVWVGGAAALTFSTMDGNVASGGTASRGGSIHAGGGSVTLRGTIVADGTGDPGEANCGAAAGTIATQGANLEAPSTASATQCNLLAALGDRFAAMARLASLSDRGGPTQTQALLNGSGALEAVPSCFPFL
ncbi:MAG: hypothetical protein M3O25_01890, partial [Actinomycetota bacterium]|nr:hypothetical protein [Actinomycetota bacterium]